MKKFPMFLVVSFLLNVYCSQIFAVGEFDTTFNMTGKVFTSFGQTPPNATLYDVAIQPDGKIVAVGNFFNGENYDIAIARYNTDGSLDTSFDGDGKVLTRITPGGEAARSVAIQTDGKIVVGGSASNEFYFDFAVLRYNKDGSLDTNFGTGGIVRTPVGFFYSSIFSIAIQPDGKIIAVGDGFGDEKDFAVVRYGKDGRLDTAFGNNGIVLTPVSPESNDLALSVAIQNDGKIVVSGVSSDTISVSAKFLSYSSFMVVRYNRNGSLDTSFDGDGVLNASFGAMYEFAESVVIQPDGKLLLSGKLFGQNGESGIIVRINPNGSLDASFDNDGFRIYSNEPVENPVVQPDGKILFSRRFGTFPNWTYVITRINSDGSDDNTFGTNGSTSNASGSLALQTNGKIIAGTTENGLFVVARLTGDSPIPAAANISGQIVDSQGRALTNVRVTINNLQTNETKVAPANPFGFFRFNQLPTDNIYQITARRKESRFNESIQTIRLLGNIDGMMITSE